MLVITSPTIVFVDVSGSVTAGGEQTFQHFSAELLKELPGT
jgi:hypothetical protein